MQCGALTEEVINKALIMVEDSVLLMGGQPLKEYGLPSPNRDVSTNRQTREHERAVIDGDLDTTVPS